VTLWRQQSITTGPSLSSQDRRDLELGEGERTGEGHAFCRTWGISVQDQIKAITYRCAQNGQRPYLFSIRADGHGMTLTKQYWRLEKLMSIDEFLAKRFPESRRNAYYLMAIHENLTKTPKQQLREAGWSKATKLAKVARKDREAFDCASWLHKSRELPKERFNGEVERHLTGKETKAWEIIYFKLCRSQLPVVAKALETAGLMLGTDESRGYCLEMICTDFLAGANLGEPQQ